MGELDPNGTGDPVERFVEINTEMRQANNQRSAKSGELIKAAE